MRRPRLSVAALITDDKGRVLMGRHRRRRPAKEKLVLPGGGIKKGETAAEALVREVLEETGLDVKSKHPTWPIDVSETATKKSHCVRLIYVAEVSGLRKYTDTRTMDRVTFYDTVSTPPEALAAWVRESFVRIGLIK